MAKKKSKRIKPRVIEMLDFHNKTKVIVHKSKKKYDRKNKKNNEFIWL